MTRPRQILYTLPNFITAGSGQLLVHIVSNLDRDRYRPSVCVARLGDVPLEHHLRGLGVPLFEAASTVAGKPWSTLFWRAFQRSREFRDKGFDLWHSFHYLDDYSEPLIARLSGSQGLGLHQEEHELESKILVVAIATRSRHRCPESGHAE